MATKNSPCSRCTFSHHHGVLDRVALWRRTGSRAIRAFPNIHSTRQSQAAGTYVIEVRRRTGSPLDYRLNVSVENHPIAPDQATDDFDRGDLDILGNITIVGAGQPSSMPTR